MPDDPSPPVSISDLSGTSLLRLSRASRDAARKKLRGLPLEAQAGACLELRPESRSEFLLLLDHPERVVPLLPDAEVCLTVRAGGMNDGAWLLELATVEQRRACFDLDCWDGTHFALERFEEWTTALIEVGPAMLATAIGESDLELWVLWLRARAAVLVLGKEDVPPEGSLTIDGVVHFVPLDDTSPAGIEQVARALFSEAQPLYWQLVYGVLFESASEIEEYALRWRGARLNDLGFPDRESALSLYARLAPESATDLEPSQAPSAPSAASGVVPAPGLPRQLEGSRVGEALRKLSPERARERLGFVLAVANAVAVADDLVLSDPETLPRALEKAVKGIDVGLAEVARVRGLPLEEALAATAPGDLFRVGATLEVGLRKAWVPEDDEEEA